MGCPVFKTTHSQVSTIETRCSKLSVGLLGDKRKPIPKSFSPYFREKRYNGILVLAFV